MPNVSKGAGRPAAASRLAKAAQKTELPTPAEDCNGGDGHDAHMALNGECPWCGAAKDDELMSDAKLKAYAKKHGLGAEAAEAMIEAARAVKAETPEAALSAWNDLGDGGDESNVEMPEKPMGKRTVRELHAVAAKMGISGHRSLAKGPLLNAILEAEKAAVTVPAMKTPEERVEQVFAVASQDEPDEVSCTGDVLAYQAGKSYPKAKAFTEECSKLKWATEMKPDANEDRVQVIARRGEHEAIEIEWVGGVFQGDTCYYSHSGRSAIKLRNASHAKKQMAVLPAEAAATAQKVSAHKAARPARRSAGETTTERRKALPFDVETATTKEILQAVTGRSISWTNEISGGIEEAAVLSKISIKDGTSGRSIEFVSHTGYRSVRVASLVSIR